MVTASNVILTSWLSIAFAALLATVSLSPAVDIPDHNISPLLVKQLVLELERGVWGVLRGRRQLALMWYPRLACFPTGQGHAILLDAGEHVVP